MHEKEEAGKRDVDVWVWTGGRSPSPVGCEDAVVRVSRWSVRVDGVRGVGSRSVSGDGGFRAVRTGDGGSRRKKLFVLHCLSRMLRVVHLHATRENIDVICYEASSSLALSVPILDILCALDPSAVYRFSPSSVKVSLWLLLSAS